MITLKLTSPTNTPEGEAVKLLLTSHELLSMIEHSGIAFSGTKHSLTIKDSETNLITWLEFAEDYLGKDVSIITSRSITLIKHRKTDIIDFWSK